ncbi:MAG: hypothetical protein AAF721_14250, partial [Myxococcota bacterium]
PLLARAGEEELSTAVEQPGHPLHAYAALRGAGADFSARAEDDWYYTQFSTDAPQYNTIPEQDSCSCHAPWEERTITIAGLKEFKTTGSLIELVCDQPGNTPCAPKVYE